MIKDLEIECESIDGIDGTIHHRMLKLRLLNVDNSFLADIPAEEIVMFQDINPLLEAIGTDVVGEWYMSLGGQR